jgi:Asp-tRNA(Asn)/Glu-tRNA(Gln) amidotransferase A subunit family amidase
MNPTTEPYRFSASQAVAEIKSGRLSVEQYAKSLLSRFEERDATVHAWAYLNPDLVLQEAKKLDAIPPAERGPLHGVAIGVKDVILTKGARLKPFRGFENVPNHRSRHANAV